MIDRACISLNNNCNMRCRYCHFQDKQKDFDSFSFQQLKLILDNIHAYCFKRAIKKFKLGLVGSGEPILYDVTFSVLVGCSEKDLFISYEDFLTFMEYVKETGLKSRQFRDEKCYDCIMYGKLCGVGRSNIFIAPEGIYPCGRFYKMSDYYLGAYDATLDEIEEHMHRFTPVQDGKCYYIENIEVMR